MALTVRQKAFADLYIKLGNASEAARQAGYSKRTAGNIGFENLEKPEIAAYIKERLAAAEAARIADANEVMRFFTSVLRGEEKDQFGLDVAMTDRLNAGKELLRRFERAEGRNNSEVLQKAKDLLGEIDGVID